MYRRHTILARTISIELPLRRSAPEIAAINRHAFARYDIGLNPSIDSQLIRDRLPPLFCDKRRFSLQASHGDTGLSESFSER